MADNFKPLPQIPVTTDDINFRLSIDSRDHLLGFITHSLHASGIGEGWGDYIYAALEDLGDSVDRGKWLSGAKRRRLQTPGPGIRHVDESIRTLWDAIAEPVTPTRQPTPAQLVLLVTPFMAEDRIQDANCVFHPGSFTLGGNSHSVLYGLSEWDDKPSDNVRIVGGTFTFTGAISQAQHAALSDVLRLGIYVHLSLLLEQSFLANSHVQLKFAPTVTPEPSPPPTPEITQVPSPPNSIRATRTSTPSFLSSGILSFFSKRKTKANPSGPATAPRAGGSLDIHRTESRGRSSPTFTPTTLEETRIRRFSFMSGEHRVSLPKSIGSPLSAAMPDHSRESSETSDATATSESRPTCQPQFTQALSLLQAHSHLQSTSPSVRYAPPILLSRFAEREAEAGAQKQQLNSPSTDASIRSDSDSGSKPIANDKPASSIALSGDERVALGSIIGWGSNQDNGITGTVTSAVAGMTSLPGFVRQQGLSVLYSEGVPVHDETPRPVPTPRPSDRDRSSTISGLSIASSGGATKVEDEQVRSSSASLAASSLSAHSTASTTTNASTDAVHAKAKAHPTYAPCEKPIWIHYRYYVRSANPSPLASPPAAANRPPVNRMSSSLSVLSNLTASSSSSREMSSISSASSSMSKNSTTTLRVPPVPDKDTSDNKTGLSVVTDTETTTSKLTKAPSTVRLTHDDPSLGMLLLSLVSTAEDACAVKGCKYTKGEHVRRWVHGGVEVKAVLSNDVISDSADPDTNPDFGPDDLEKPEDVPVGVNTKKERKDVGTQEPDEAKDDQDSEEPKIMMWSSCFVCAAKTARLEVDDGTFLFSFAKFLELLVYSPAVCTLTPVLCSHTTAPGTDGSPKNGVTPALPDSRVNILPHFAVIEGKTAQRTVTFTLSVIDDVFELRVPRLQMSRHGEKANKILPLDASTSEDEKRTLRREIIQWWHGISEHIDKLEDMLAAKDDLGMFRKGLPRLPSEDPESLYEETPPTTPTKSRISGLPPLPPSPLAGIGTMEDYLAQPSSGSPTRAPELLSSLRHSFQKAEQLLFAELSETPPASLNDVRRSFVSAARGASRRLVAWQNKHLRGSSASETKIQAPEPEWWSKDCHAVPGGNIIVRENDWGSIIAHTLGSADYAKELASLTLGGRPLSSASGNDGGNVTSRFGSLREASLSVTPSSGLRKLWGGTQLNPDPDEDGAVWHEPEAYTAVITRTENASDLASLLSLRASALPLPRFGNSLRSRHSHALLPSAWSKADVQLSTHAADGEVVSVASDERPGSAAGRMLHDLDQAASWAEIEHTDTVDSPVGSYASSSGSFDTRMQPGKPSALFSFDSDTTITPEIPDGSTLTANSNRPAIFPPPPPPKDEDAKTDQCGVRAAPVQPSPEADTQDVPPSPASTASMFGGSLTSSLGQAVRYMFPTVDTPSRSNSPFSPKNHHGLLYTTEFSTIDERPHIKYVWTVGKRRKFSCTVYYAKQFDSIRRRCGIDDMFLKSLGRSTNWAADGGKSSSNFWKTADDRLIIKTLVNAWNVADLQVLIDLGPQYFRYMDSTASKATALAKLVGFYTIEIKNTETNTVDSTDLLVMENLFHDQKITKAFDLKGIQGRKVKGSKADGSSTTAKTLFDGEWIEGQKKTLTLVRPHSKVVLQEAIKSDADFLAKSNIMDYSLLVGVDEEQKQIACGIVDTIGSYTFAKTLEYKAKHNLAAGKDVTVIPPAEYQDRFVNALDRYFVACPDKWSKPMNDSQILPHTVNALPSVL